MLLKLNIKLLRFIVLLLKGGLKFLYEILEELKKEPVSLADDTSH